MNNTLIISVGQQISLAPAFSEELKRAGLGGHVYATNLNPYNKAIEINTCFGSGLPLS